MMRISREVPVKIGKHAWSAYPLEAFGFLLGCVADNAVHAALPFPDNLLSGVTVDRWLVLAAQIGAARTVAQKFNQEVVGIYTSKDGFDPHVDFPVPSIISETSMGLYILYEAVCCPSCSSKYCKINGRVLKLGEDYSIALGKRISDDLNQGRILAEWNRAVGASVSM